MSRDTRLMVVVGIAVLVAALASFGMYKAIASQSKTVVEAPKVFVVVAKKPLEMGTTVAESEVKLVAWPKDGQVAGTFTSTKDVLNRGLIASVLENEPITASKLAPVDGGVGLSPTIRPGMRAMSVKVNEVIGVAGFATPGTRVDVLVTIRDKDSWSRVVVQDVQVLTAGTKYDDPEARKQGKAIPSTVVTLMVSPADAEKIALATSQGQIMLALRNSLDKDHTPTSGARIAGLMAQSAPAAAPAAPPAERRPVGRVARVEAQPAPPPPPRTVETFKGTKRGIEVIR